ncbi:hypothetical protein COOONC_14976, partial [Cooperia oncophora]
QAIISCVVTDGEGPTDRITWFITKFWLSCVDHRSLPNTQMFLNHLSRVHSDSTCVMESFDVEALYTNVTNSSAMEAVSELLTQHRNMFRTAATVCTREEERKESLRMAREIAGLNGYNRPSPMRRISTRTITNRPGGGLLYLRRSKHFHKEVPEETGPRKLCWQRGDSPHNLKAV